MRCGLKPVISRACVFTSTCPAWPGREASTSRRATPLRGKRKAKQRTARGCREISTDRGVTARIQDDAVEIRLCFFILVPKRQLAIFRCGAQGARLRRERDVSVVTHPDSRLMCTDEARNRRVVVVVRGHADLVLAGLCRPVGHAERCRHKGHRATVTERTHLCPNQRVDERDGVSLRIANHS